MTKANDTKNWIAEKIFGLFSVVFLIVISLVQYNASLRTEITTISMDNLTEDIKEVKFNTRGLQKFIEKVETLEARMDNVEGELKETNKRLRLHEIEDSK
jgi:predicted nuclease with TOPRIM domain